MTKWPCKDCLLLPVCKPRRDIECELLYNYINKYVGDIEKYHHRITAPVLKIFDKRVAAIGPKYRVRLIAIREYSKEIR